MFNFLNQDHNYSLNIENAKLRIESLERRAELAEKRYWKARRRERTANQKCKKLLKQLEERNLLSSELADKLSVYQGWLCL